MSPKLEFRCLATTIGTMPHTDPKEACSLIATHLPQLPGWPQLPQRSFHENMYAQLSEGFPGAVIEGDRFYIDRHQDITGQLEQLYSAYLENDVERYPISPEYAAGLHAFLSSEIRTPLGIKGQLSGPFSWGLTVTDQDHRPIFYDEVLGDAMVKFLRLKAAWQERALSQLSTRTIIFVDEPNMVSLGSAFCPVSPEQVRPLLEEVLGGIGGLKGIHCCGNTDWSQLLKIGIDILSFDAYGYAETLSLYPAEVKSFLQEGKAIAWGIVPNQEEYLVKESVVSLRDRLEEAMAPFTRNGIGFSQLLEQALLTPSCGLSYLSPEAAAQALELLAGLSAKLRSTRL